MSNDYEMAVLRNTARQNWERVLESRKEREQLAAELARCRGQLAHRDNVIEGFRDHQLLLEAERAKVAQYEAALTTLRKAALALLDSWDPGVSFSGSLDNSLQALEDAIPCHYCLQTQCVCP